MQQYYRLYLLNLDGRFRGVIEIECEGDAQAIATADGQPKGQAMELWERSRKVKAWPAAA